MSKIWGYHLRVNAICDKGKISDRQNVRDFSKELVEKIRMIPYGEPLVVYFAEHDEGKAGFTLVQLIYTSSITAHFVDATGEMYLDVFSCKEFDYTQAINVAKDFFKITEYNSDYSFRKAGAV